MRNLMVVIAFVVAAASVAGQSWTPPRTPWGDPDLQGFWPSAEMLGVPFERPANLGERATLTDEEFAQLRSEERRVGKECRSSWSPPDNQKDTWRSLVRPRKKM